MPEQPKPEQPKENPHVHRFSSYVKNLEKHWAYAGLNKIPKPKY
tara:strand:+ start:688 stop:819 length:132 start_codon:yes stop_codon:yes gene_type:complete